MIVKKKTAKGLLPSERKVQSLPNRGFRAGGPDREAHGMRHFAPIESVGRVLKRDKQGHRVKWSARNNPGDPSLLLGCLRLFCKQPDGKKPMTD